MADSIGALVRDRLGLVLRQTGIGHVLGGVALVVTCIAVLATFVVCVDMWETTWRAAVEPIRANIYNARLGPSHCLSKSWSWWWTEGCKLI
jgi:hypothetical protein